METDDQEHNGAGSIGPGGTLVWNLATSQYQPQNAFGDCFKMASNDEYGGRDGFESLYPCWISPWLKVEIQD